MTNHDRLMNIAIDAGSWDENASRDCLFIIGASFDSHSYIRCHKGNRATLSAALCAAMDDQECTRDLILNVADVYRKKKGGEI